MLARLPDAWRRPGNLDARGRPRALLDQRPNATRDVYENRVVCAWVELADAALRRLASLAPSAPVDALRGQIREARATLDALGDVAVLDAMPTRVSMALARRREYRAALDGFLELLRSGQARLDEDALGAPLDNIPTLYQRWATLRTLSRCLRCACEQGWKLRSQTLARIERGGVVVKVLPGGVAALVFERGDGATVRVFVERQYGAGGALRSLTYPQRPDVTVERFEPGRGHALWVLDPKYKLVADVEGASQPVKADIDKMHAYRDAIRDSLGRPVVRHAAILYLGETMRWGAEISAIGARPTASEALDADLDSLFHTVFVMPHGDPE